MRRALIALAVAGCGAAPQKPAETTPVSTAAPPSAEEERRDDEVQIQGELGTLEQEQIDAGFRPRLGAINGCYQDGVAKLWYLGGALELRVRVDQEGGVKEVSAVRALGNFTVEKCILDEVRGLRFARPKGGHEAEFNYTWNFRAKTALKDWSNDDVGRHFDKHRAEIDACEKKGPVPAGLRVTFFVGPGGKVTSVGVGADGPVADSYASCVIGRVQAWRFDDPLGRIARATYQF